jgi:hypothetical protein
MILPVNNRAKKQQKDIPVHSFLPDGSTVSTDKINGHFIWGLDFSMCDPSYPCDELTILDIECDITHQMHRHARKRREQYAKTSYGFQTYYPHDDEDDYPEPIPVPTTVPVLLQKLAHPWKPRKIMLPSLEELLKKVFSPQKNTERPPILLDTTQSKVSCKSMSDKPIVHTQPIPCMIFTPHSFPTTEPVHDD